MRFVPATDERGKYVQDKYDYVARNELEFITSDLLGGAALTTSSKEMYVVVDSIPDVPDDPLYRPVPLDKDDDLMFDKADEDATK